jgi:hypothetical protein
MTAPKKKLAAKRTQFAVWLLDPKAPARVERLVALMQAEMPIKGIRISTGQAVLAAVEEAIERREKAR